MLTKQLKKPVLWSYHLSTCSWRVRIALNLKQIDYEYKAVDLLKKTGGDQFSNEFTLINPKQEVPVLFIDGHYLVQSIPIIEYINETRKNGVNLLPKSSIERAKVRAIAEIINSGIQPYQNASTLKRVAENMGKLKRNEWLNFYLNKGLRAVETNLKETSGKYCVGDEISLADVCLVPQISAANRMKIDLSNFPLINSINLNLEKVPEFIKAHPKNQIDALSLNDKKQTN